MRKITPLSPAFPFLTLMFLSLSLGAAGSLSAQETCWKCGVSHEPISTFCEETSSDGHVDCEENMSHTWCSVEEYSECEEAEPLALLTSGAAMVTPGLPLHQENASIHDSGQILRNCQGILIGRVYPESHRTSVRALTAQITL